MDFANLKNLQAQLNQALKMHNNPKIKVAKNSSVWSFLYLVALNFIKRTNQWISIFTIIIICLLGLNLGTNFTQIYNSIIKISYATYQPGR